MTKSSKFRLLLVLLVAALAMGATACGDDEAPSTSGNAPSSSSSSSEIPDGPTITIGAQDFTESKILAEIYLQALEAKGYKVKRKDLGGYRDLVLSAFKGKDINMTPEYAASLLEFINNKAGEATSDIKVTMQKLQPQLAKKDLYAYDAAPAVDQNQLVVTKETAERLHLAKISDLTSDLKLGAVPDCEQNASCIPGIKTKYGIDLSANFVPLDGGGPLTKSALDKGSIDVAILFSTDATIKDKGWVVLEDDKGLVNSDNVVPVTTKELDATYGEAFEELVNKISAAITTEKLSALNKRVDTDKEDASVVAKDFLTDEDLI